MKESVQFREETKRSLKKLQGKRLKLTMKLTSLATEITTRATLTCTIALSLILRPDEPWENKPLLCLRLLAIALLVC